MMTDRSGDVSEIMLAVLDRFQTSYLTHFDKHAASISEMTYQEKTRPSFKAMLQVSSSASNGCALTDAGFPKRGCSFASRCCFSYVYSAIGKN